MLLTVQDLHIEFHDKDRPETAVYDFDLTMEQGEIVGIVGESGSGKTISALAIAGLLNRKNLTKDGTILFDGKDILHCSRKELRQIQGKDIGVIFQEPMTSLNPLMKIGPQVEESLKLHSDLSKEELREKALQAMTDAELPEPEKLYDLYPHNLSGGMRQRVMIAAAIITNPRLLIADEPTTALDVTVQAGIVKLLRKLQEEKNISILFISHDLSLVRQLCPRVLVMKDGRIVEEGITEEIFRNPVNPYTQNLIASIPKVPKRPKKEA